MLTSGVEIADVSDLYAQYDRLAAIDLGAHGASNPLEGRVAVIPRKAAHYAMVHAEDQGKLDFARMVMRGVAKRKRVREIVCEKHDVNFSHFAPAGKVVVLYA